MSTYVMSDIHGCFDEFMQMLNLIVLVRRMNCMCWVMLLIVAQNR